MTRIREHLTPEQRATDLDLTIDPGFVNHRKIQTIIGKMGMEFIDLKIKNLPDLPEWQKDIRLDHIYTEAVLIFCKTLGVQTLQQNLYAHKGQLVCSVERLGPCPDVYDKVRVISEWIRPENIDINVQFRYSTAHIRSDTTRSRLHAGNRVFAIVAELLQSDGKLAAFDPLVMGPPWLSAKDETPTFDIMRYGYDFFENFAEDFDEFTRVKDILIPSDVKPMRYISENAFKQCLAEILGDAVQNVRLAKEPAQVLCVQHCHDITPPVRETLRAFAVQPGNARRFCIIDGRDSLRLLQAYNLYNKAIELSRRNESGV